MVSKCLDEPMKTGWFCDLKRGHKGKHQTHTKEGKPLVSWEKEVTI